MKFEWDEAKREANIRKHAIDFVGVEEVFKGYTVTIEDGRIDYSEQRFITLGQMQGRVVVVIHTERGDSIRTISIRKATKYEQKFYFSEIPY